MVTRSHRIKTSPRLPVNWPSMYSSVLASCRIEVGNHQRGTTTRHKRQSEKSRYLVEPRTTYLQVHVRVDRHQVAWRQGTHSFSTKILHFYRDKIFVPHSKPSGGLTLSKSVPLYSIPHFSFTMTGFPVRSFKNGFGLTGTVCNTERRI
jgi:hypothetical protein